MFRRMLFAPDLAAASHLTLDCVAGWRYLGIANVTLAQVHSVGYAAGAAGPGVKLRADHAPTLERQAQRVRDAGVGASRRLESGVPYLGIQGFAREEGAEAVILGSHGSSWIKEI